MRRVLVVCASHRGVALETQQCIAALEQQGARVLSATGITDVALARNSVLTQALALVRKESPNTDVLLLVDDDMVWLPAAAATLVSLTRQTGTPWSGAYTTYDRVKYCGYLAATPLDWNAQRDDGLRMVGLGFCAVPVAQLEALAAKLGTVVGPSETPIVPFCESRTVTPEHDNIPRWCSEDYWLCRALGGVRLAPNVAAGHLKTVPLWPDTETLRLIAEGLPLSAEPSSPSEPPAPPASPEPPPPAPTTNPETPASKKKKKGRTWTPRTNLASS